MRLYWWWKWWWLQGILWWSWWWSWWRADWLCAYCTGVYSTYKCHFTGCHETRKRRSLVPAVYLPWFNLWNVVMNAEGWDLRYIEKTTSVAMPVWLTAFVSFLAYFSIFMPYKLFGRSFIFPLKTLVMFLQGMEYLEKKEKNGHNDYVWWYFVVNKFENKKYAKIHFQENCIPLDIVCHICYYFRISQILWNEKNSCREQPHWWNTPFHYTLQ